MNTYNQDLYHKVMEVEDLMVVLLVEDNCFPSEDHWFVAQVLEKIRHRNLEGRFFVLCFDDASDVFPVPEINTVYFFAPKNPRPLFHKSGGSVLQDVDLYYHIAERMWKKDISYKEAAYDEEDQKLFEETEKNFEEESKTRDEYPPLFNQARDLGKNIWNSMKRKSKGLPMLVPRDVAFERFSECSNCPFFTKEKRCTKCGCFMMSKVNLAVSECPIGKWGTYQEEEE